MRRWLPALPVCLFLQLAGAAGMAAETPEEARDPPDSAQAPPGFPTIREIAFEGNDVTQPITMLRELVVSVGGPANPKRVERSRQAIQDLGLFREVKVRQEPLDDGVRVVFTVREKWYVLPIPRLEANSDGDTGLGMQIRWNNLWGLNHSLEALAVRRDYQRDDRDSSYNYFINYDVPFLGSSQNALGVSLSHADQDSSDNGYDYNELVERFAVVYSRSLSKKGPSSQGWKLGIGMGWENQSANGEYAPADYGMATTLIGRASYNDTHDYIYSRTGEAFSSSVAFSSEGVVSDYSYINHYSTYRRYVHVGRREHQSVNFLVDLGGYHGGPISRQKEAFELGGSTHLRGYDRELIEGDFLYYAAVEYLRPLHWDWLRLLTVLEGGSAIEDIAHPGENETFYASVGIGVRVRFTWFVDLELEVGCAYPLISQRKLRFFASSI